METAPKRLPSSVAVSPRTTDASPLDRTIQWRGLRAVVMAIVPLLCAPSTPRGPAAEAPTPAGDRQVRIEPLGPLVRCCSLPGESAEDGMFPAHPSGIQLARDRFLVLYSTRGVRCHDDDGSIVYQVRAQGFDGPVLHEGFLARRIEDWDPFRDGSAYVKLLRHPVAFGVPKGALVDGALAANANLFGACWSVQAPGTIDRTTGTYYSGR